MAERIRELLQPSVLATPSSHLAALRPFSPTSALETAPLHAPQLRHSLANITLQPKLTVSSPGDQYEQEAERVAASVVRQLDASAGGEQSQANTQAAPAAQSLVQRSAVSGTPIEPETAQAVESARGGGQALPAQLGRQMGAAFGADFSGLHIHTDQRADTLNRALSARAFTTGQDVFFRQGEYQPSSRAGQQLLAHELTHVVQQTGNIQRMVDMTFKGSVGLVAGLTSAHNKKYDKITEKFKTYQTVSKKAGKTTQATNKKGGKPTKIADTQELVKEEYNLLKEMQKDATAWIQTYHPDEGKVAESPLKAADLRLLLNEIYAELKKHQEIFRPAKGDRYLEIMAQYKKDRNAGYINTSDKITIFDEYKNALTFQREKNIDMMKYVMGISEMANETFETLNPKFETHLAGLKYRADIMIQLTPAERAAINTYTNNQYKLINPVMAIDPKWFEAGLKGIGFGGERAEPDKAMKANKKIGKMAISGLKNMPDWKQDQLIYRGETLTRNQGDELMEGRIKRYPHFVSVSLEQSTPRKMIKDNITPERPFQVLWVITRSKNGKNVASLSAASGEKEILFTPNTEFKISGIPKPKNIKEINEVLLEEV